MRALLRIVISLVALAAYHVFLWGAELGSAVGGPYDNCVLWTFRQRQQHGGYILLMPSLLYPWPHAAWTQDLASWQQYVPDGERGKRTIPPVVFRGHSEPWTRDDWERRARITARLKQRLKETRT